MYYFVSGGYNARGRHCYIKVEWQLVLKEYTKLGGWGTRHISSTTVFS